MNGRSGKMRSRSDLLPPYLLAIYPLLYLFAANFQQLSVRHLALPAVLVLTAVSLLLVVMRCAAKSWQTAGLLAALFVLLFITHHSMDSVLKARWLLPRAGQREPLLLAAEAALFFAGSVVLLRVHAAWLPLFLNVTIGAMLLFPVFSIAAKALTAAERQAPKAASQPAPTTANRPNVYYLILDAYGRSDVLQRIYGYDNSWFTEALQKAGFFVARGSFSNYSQTLLSLASSLNFSYLDRFSQFKRGSNRGIVQHEVMYSDAVKTFRALGYRFVNFPSGYSGSDVPHADVRMEPPFSLNEFHQLLLTRSPIPAVLRLLPFPVAHHFQYVNHRRRIRYTLQHLVQPLLSEPKFVLAHVLAPHPPFVFGRGGEERNPRGNFHLLDANESKKRRRPEEYVARYVDQLEYISRETLAAVTRIKHGDPQALIIIHGDHGPASRLQWEKPDRTDMQERHGILLALYGPEQFKATLYDSMSPVNSLRHVFRHFFGIALPPLKDRAYFSRWSRPYDFMDVTELVQRDPQAN